MKKDDWKNFLMIIATLIVSIISLGTFSVFSQIIFIIIFLLICFLAFSYLNRKSNIKKIFLGLLCSVEIIILAISIFTNNGSFVNFCNRIKNFFVSSQEVSSENVIVSDIDFEPYFNDFNEKMENFEKNIKSTNENMEKLDNDLNFIANNLESINFNKNINEVEIDKIIKEIEDTCEKYSDFADVKNDIYSLELLYKIWISEEPYYYCNILEAFDRFGINVDKLDIDENTLFVWDIEILYARYNIKQEILRISSLDENAIGGIYEYNDNRVTMQKYSDTFDYGGWEIDYNDSTAKECDEKLNNLILSYYKKLIINFSEEFD